MNAAEEKPNRGKEAETEDEPSRSAEIRKIIEWYADDLREVIKKFRRRMHCWCCASIGGGRKDHVP